MRHGVFAACLHSGALRAPVALLLILAWSAPQPASSQTGPVATQGFGSPWPAADPASQPPPLSLTVSPSMFSMLPLRSGHDLGLSWSVRLPADQAIDITAWRRMPPQPADALSLIQRRAPLYGARVELNLAPARSRLATDLRAIGLQLDNGARILLRRKDGNPTLYYRAQF